MHTYIVGFSSVSKTRMDAHGRFCVSLTAKTGVRFPRERQQINGLVGIAIRALAVDHPVDLAERKIYPKSVELNSPCADPPPATPMKSGFGRISPRQNFGMPVWPSRRPRAIATRGFWDGSVSKPTEKSIEVWALRPSLLAR